MQHVDGVSPAWPIDYDTLAPYYDAAERLYHVHGQAGDDPTEAPRAPYPYPPIPHAPRMAAIVEELRGARPASVAAAARADPAGRGRRLPAVQHLQLVSVPDPREERRRRPAACARRSASRTSRCGPARARIDCWRPPSGSRVEAVEVERAGERRRVEAGLVIVSCGAVNSAALLLRSAGGAHPQGLANSSGLVGRRYMAHLATMMQGFHPFQKNDTVFQKTVAINDFYLSGPEGYPLGQIQSQGRTHGVMAQTVVPAVPLWAYDAWVARGVDWLAMSEDLPSDRQSRAGRRGGTDSPALRAQQPASARAAGPGDQAHSQAARLLGGDDALAQEPEHHPPVRHAGLRHRLRGRRCSTRFCRAHDVENLFVVDASFFPSSAAVNPALTIIAQALRVAEHIRATDLKTLTRRT